MRICLRVIGGPHKGQEFRFARHDTFLVGRSNRAHFCLPLEDRYFSRIQFMVEVKPTACRLTDMHSRNGTFVNGQRVTSAELRDGDQLQAGETILRVSVEDVDSATDSPEQAAPPARSVPPIADVISRPRSAPPIASVLSRSRSAPPIARVISQLRSPASGIAAAAVVAPTYSTLKPAGLEDIAVEARRAVGAAAWSAPGSVSEETCRVCDTVAQRSGTPPTGQPIPLCRICRLQSLTQPQHVAGYRLVRSLGQGGMGVVYLAVRESDGLVVAVKAVTPKVVGSPAETERFLREARILSRLRHPHIVHFYEMGETEGRLFFVMEYVTGTDADDLLHSHGPLPIPRAVRLVCQLLDGLAHAHALGFVHRDIKPANLLVTGPEGREMAKLADFGLARAYQASKLSGLTLQGDLGGTPSFMPPEQITNFREVQPAGDQYSAAATLYYLLTGQTIYGATRTFADLVLQILQAAPIAIQQQRKDIPPRLAEAIHRALVREPTKRFADVAALRRALLPFASA
jgi:hypothetical protein